MNGPVFLALVSCMKGSPATVLFLAPGATLSGVDVPPPPDLLADVVNTLSGAQQALAAKGYDAILVRIDGPRELSLILQLKGLAPSMPLIALEPSRDAALGELARDSGALEVVEDLGRLDPAAMLRVRAQAAMAAADQLQRQMQLTCQRFKRIERGDVDVRSACEALVPLVIEDEPDEGDLLERLFQRLSLPFPLPILRSAEEAIAFLSRQGPYADRHRYPSPNLVITDLHLPKSSGHDLVGWIRTRPELSSLVVFILTSSIARSDLLRAMELGADHYYVKPFGLHAQLDLTESMMLRWHLLRRFHQFNP